MKKDKSPIGVFDSGIGGLAVLKELAQKFPGENYLYVGDTARAPYGNRSKQEITKFSQQILKFVLKNKVKAVIVACNTICATSLEVLRKNAKVPIYDIILPTIRAAGRNYGLVATKNTVNSDAYLTSKSVICFRAAGLIENGKIDEARKEIQEAVLSLINCDCVILGCTHFSFLKEQIYGNRIIDSSSAMVDQLTFNKIGKGGVKICLTGKLSPSKNAIKNLWPESLKYKWQQITL